MKSLCLGAISLLGILLPATSENLPRFTYCLQLEGTAKTRTEAVQTLETCDLDWLVIDYAFYGDEGSRWTREEIDQVRSGKVDRKVIAYLSIGEAGIYRSYWRNAWVTESKAVSEQAPDWLLGANPHWPEDYRVKYWESGWKEIVLNHLDAILESGFDGVWLDTVDTFEYFEHDAETDEWIDHRKNRATGNTYREDMITMVQRIAEKGRSLNPDFLVIPNNATQLLSNETYRKTISGQGIEDLFTDGEQVQDREHTKFILGNLWGARAEGIPMLLIEYCEKESAREMVIVAARQQGISLSITDRALKTLGTAYLPE